MRNLDPARPVRRTGALLLFFPARLQIYLPPHGPAGRSPQTQHLRMIFIPEPKRKFLDGCLAIHIQSQLIR